MHFFLQRACPPSRICLAFKRVAHSLSHREAQRSAAAAGKGPGRRRLRRCARHALRRGDWSFGHLPGLLPSTACLNAETSFHCFLSQHAAPGSRKPASGSAAGHCRRWATMAAAQSPAAGAEPSLLTGQEDSYDGLIVDEASVPASPEAFQAALAASLAVWRQVRAGCIMKAPVVMPQAGPLVPATRPATGAIQRSAWRPLRSAATVGSGLRSRRPSRMSLGTPSMLALSSTTQRRCRSSQKAHLHVLPAEQRQSALRQRCDRITYHLSLRFRIT